jgi:predicted permease
MSWWQRLLRRRSLEQQLDAELRDHLSRQVADLVRSGLGEADARRRAVLEFGGLEQTKEHCRDARGTRLVEELLQDTRYACRTLRKRPGFAIAALLLLALGIGANTTIFSLLEAVLVRQVPVSRPDRLFFVAHHTARGIRTASNYPFLERLQAQRDVFDGVTAYTTTSFRVSGDEGTERVPGEYAAGNYHGLIGVRLGLGRGFAAEDDRDAAASSIAVISDRYWTQKFHRSSAVLGQVIHVNGRALTIVGVTARGFEGFTPGRPSAITVPLSQKALDSPGYLTMHDTWTSLSPVARLRAGVAEGQATEVVDRVLRQYLAEPDNKWYKAEAALLRPADRGSDELRAQYSASLAVLMAMVVVVLLIASANFANLQLANASARAKEVSIRLAIGAGRGRLVRQLLTESLVLALAGGALGLLIAFWGVRLIGSQFQAARNPVVLDADPNLIVMAFTAGISLLTGFVFGLVPALRATRVQLTSALKSVGAGDPGGRRWGGRRVLVVTQIALSLLLIAGAGLLVGTLRNLQAPDGSFDARGVSLLALAGDDDTEDVLLASCRDLVARLEAHREITAAACSTATPVDMSFSRRRTLAGTKPIDGGVLANVVTPGFFRTFGVPVLRGRALTDQDSPTAQRVAVINERMARLAFDDAEPLGRTFHFGAEPDQQITVVGVARDVRSSLRDAASATVYTPIGQGGEIGGDVSVAVRSTQPAGTVAEILRREGRALPSEVTVGRPVTLDDQIGGQLARERTLALLSSWFGVLALMLACIGLHAVLSHEVARRRRDLGIRLALGASASAVVRYVLGQATVLVVVGVAIGLAATFATTKLLTGLLFGLSARDPVTLAAAAGALGLTAFLAGYLPARRAGRIDPTMVLRSE